MPVYRILSWFIRASNFKVAGQLHVHAVQLLRQRRKAANETTAGVGVGGKELPAISLPKPKPFYDTIALNRLGRAIGRGDEA